MKKCSWCLKDELYQTYHDEEWGRPVYDDKLFFEYLVLEIFQAGLSFYTILKKRENYRKVFAEFDYKVIAKFDQDIVEKLMINEGIIRNRKKIEAIIHNAKIFQEIQFEYGSFTQYIWSFTKGKQIINNFEEESEIPASTSLSKQISKQMKKDGFKFVGPTNMYAFLQATGIVNDHIKTCHCHQACTL